MGQERRAIEVDQSALPLSLIRSGINSSAKGRRKKCEFCSLGSGFLSSYRMRGELVYIVQAQLYPHVSPYCRYEAMDTKAGRMVAWAIIDTQAMSTKDRARVLREAKVAGMLRHKHVMQIYDSWEDEKSGKVHMITELVRSGDLLSFVRGADGNGGGSGASAQASTVLAMPRHRVKLKAIKRWCRQLLEGLNYLHSLEPLPIIHRDIKCSNVLYNARDGSVKLCDFGSSCIGEILEGEPQPPN